MTEQPAREDDRDDARQAVKRRGLIAGAAALVVGMIAKGKSETVEAAYLLAGDTDNVATVHTAIIGPVFNDAVLILHNTSNGPGAVGISSSGDGLQGFANGGMNTHGVYGYSGGTPGVALRGECADIAVYGTGGNYGVLGTGIAVNGHGVYGFAGGVGGTGGIGGIGVLGDTLGTYGVYGQSEAPGGVGVNGSCVGGFGVLGRVTDGYGVAGMAATGYGVYGSSTNRHGVYGTTTAAFFGGVYGNTNTTNAIGVYGSTYNAGTAAYTATAYAGFMDGNFAVAHGTKSAAVPHPDGSYRLLYCVESPENWFEDFGEGKIVGGKADIKLDPDFVAVVSMDEYHVFLTEHDTHQHLVVTKRTATGFAVEADTEIAVLKGKKAADLTGTFSWRLVAKRKDIKPERLAKITLPTKQSVQSSQSLKSFAPPKQPDVPKPPQLPPVPHPQVTRP